MKLSSFWSHQNQTVPETRTKYCSLGQAGSPLTSCTALKESLCMPVDGLIHSNNHMLNKRSLFRSTLLGFKPLLMHPLKVIVLLQEESSWSESKSI